MKLVDSFLYFIVCWCIFLIVGIVISSIGNWIIPDFAWKLFVNILPIIIFILVYFLIWKFILEKKFPFFSWRDFTVPLQDKIWIPILFLVIGIQIFVQPFLDVYHDIRFPDIPNFKGSPGVKFDSEFIMTLIPTLIIAPIFEELLFRKVFFRQMLKENTLMTSLLVSSFYFSLIHLPMANKLVSTFLVGCTSALIYYRTGKIMYSILFHFVNNLFALIGQFYLVDLWNTFYDLKYNLWYWLIFGLGTLLFLVAAQIFWRNTEKTRENL